MSSWPISLARVTGSIPRAIIRLANAWRMSWKVTFSMPARATAGSKPRRYIPVAERRSLPGCKHGVFVV